MIDIFFDQIDYRWSSNLCIFRERHGESLEIIDSGINYMRLVADTANEYDSQAVLCYIEDLPVGYLYHAVASYYQPQILRLNNRGFSFSTPCRKAFGAYIGYCPISKHDLRKMVDAELRKRNGEKHEPI